MSDQVDSGIESFDGDARFLSNFWPDRRLSPSEPGGVYLNGAFGATVEHAYQAAKSDDPEVRRRILDAATPGQAKKLGRKVVLRRGWNQARITVLRDLVRQKFCWPQLAEKLLATGDRPIIEGNHWHDNFWGACRCAWCANAGHVGQNHLGRILEGVRAELRQPDRAPVWMRIALEMPTSELRGLWLRYHSLAGTAAQKERQRILAALLRAPQARAVIDRYREQPPSPARPRVLNRRRDGLPAGAVYVGRGSVYGNPWSHLPNSKAEFTCATRGETIEAFRSWLLGTGHRDVLQEQRRRLVEALPALTGKDLVCYCAPEPCHAEVLRDIVNDPERLKALRKDDAAFEKPPGDPFASLGRRDQLPQQDAGEVFNDLVKERVARRPRSVQHDPLVRLVLSTFDGARIVAVRPLPRKEEAQPPEAASRADETELEDIPFP